MAAPELVLGTQMERHIAKRLGVPAAVISAPIHVQDVPARYSPQMGWEGANVIFDGWVHPLMMGLEEHLLGMFREDFEFGDGAGASHLGHGVAGVALAASAPPAAPAVVVHAPAGGAPVAAPVAAVPAVVAAGDVRWAPEAEKELGKIPFFVRGKVRRNTERFAADRGVATVSVETLYEAKAHYGR
jgi:light-independent protochlorophyllide reductase subunit B